MNKKKTLIILVLAVGVIATVCAFTYALYVTASGNTGGAVTAKEFVLTSSGSDGFSTDVSIAPEERQAKSFSVRNYDGDTVSELPMSLAIKVQLSAVDGKNHIVPLKLTVTKEGVQVGEAVYTDTAATVDISDEFAATATQYIYTVEIYWEGTDNDIAYAGANFSDELLISVVGTQQVNG